MVVAQEKSNSFSLVFDKRNLIAGHINSFEIDTTKFDVYFGRRLLSSSDGKKIMLISFKNDTLTIFNKRTKTKVYTEFLKFMDPKFDITIYNGKVSLKREININDFRKILFMAQLLNTDISYAPFSIEFAEVEFVVNNEMQKMKFNAASGFTLEQFKALEESKSPIAIFNFIVNTTDHLVRVSNEIYYISYTK